MTASIDETKAAAEQYVLLDRRTVVGNCAMWWCPEGKGYTCDLDEAGRFTYEEAHSHRDTDIPVPLSLAETMSIRHVRVDQLCNRMSLWPGKWPVEQRLADPNLKSDPEPKRRKRAR